MNWPAQAMVAHRLDDNQSTLSDFVSVRGARQHNLKNVNIDIPRDKLVVITGPSGSGKSSLAIDTIFAEGQRQFIETLSTYTRSLIPSLPRADVDWIEGLQPTLCINQFPPPPNPRSTVGTVTELLDYMRLLYARLGQVTCYKCGNPIRQMEMEAIIDTVSSFPDATKVIVLAPLVKRRRGKNEDTLEQIRRTGLLRARINGEVRELDDITLQPNKLHTIEAVTDRLIIRSNESTETSQQRLRESIQLAVQLGNGVCTICSLLPGGEGDPDWTDTTYSTLYACVYCGVHYDELEPRSFSFNGPEGACAECDGLGGFLQFDFDQVVPDRSKTFATGLAIWNSLPKSQKKKSLQELKPFLDKNNLDEKSKLSELSDLQWSELIDGDQKADWIGLGNVLQKELAICTDEERLQEIQSFQAIDRCPVCGGSRLGPLSRAVFLGDNSFAALSQMTLRDIDEFFESFEFPNSDLPAARPLVNEIRKRLRFLLQVSLGYLSLDRPTETLSGGEYQRVRLASAIGTGLSQVCFVLDEPTIGLHSTDNQKLIDSLRALRDQGNSVIVVEHDREMIEAADWIIDVGPLAGREGGHIVFQGTLDELQHASNSPTGQYFADDLPGVMETEQGTLFDDEEKVNSIEIRGASGHNLKSIDVVIPLERFVCITGVSGSGKSSLLQRTIAPAVRRQLGMSAPRPLPYEELIINGRIDRLIQIDQRPIGRSPRSNAATYTGIMDELRKIFSQTREAKLRGFNASRFSFNSSSGQCRECKGAGTLKVEMKFLPDMHKTCPVCQGRRFDWATLQVKYRDHSIADILEMPIGESHQLFENIERIRAPMQALVDVGLGYLSLGQASSQLSGGEAQRIKLANELASANRVQHNLYLMDEPTTGLHFADVQRLLKTLRNLVRAGSSLVVIEHHPDVIQQADYVIEIGPGAGESGGEVAHAGYR